MKALQHKQIRSLLSLLGVTPIGDEHLLCQINNKMVFETKRTISFSTVAHTMKVVVWHYLLMLYSLSNILLWTDINLFYNCNSLYITIFKSESDVCKSGV